MIVRLGKRFYMDGNFLMIGQWEIIFIPRVYAPISSTKWLGSYREGRTSYMFMGRRVLTITRLGTLSKSKLNSTRQRR